MLLRLRPANAPLPIPYHLPDKALTRARVKNVLTLSGQPLYCYVLGRVQDETTGEVYFLTRLERDSPVYRYTADQIDWPVTTP